MTRLDYLKARYSFSKLLDTYECREFSEYTIKCGGSIFTIRVRGDENTGFSATER